MNNPDSRLDRNLHSRGIMPDSNSFTRSQPWESYLPWIKPRRGDRSIGSAAPSGLDVLASSTQGLRPGLRSFRRCAAESIHSDVLTPLRGFSNSPIGGKLHR